MIHRCGAAGPPGYGGVTEDAVGEQEAPEERPPDEGPDDNTPGYAGGPEGKSELGNPPSELEEPLDVARIAEPPPGEPVD